MIVKSQDGLSVCNKFDFSCRETQYSNGVYEIVNKLDGMVYGTYQMSTCKRVLKEIYNQAGTYGQNSKYEFPEYDL